MNIWFLAFVLLSGLICHAEGQIQVINDYNPGSCNQQNHGKEVLVKDRKDDDKTLICVKKDDDYNWISADGSSILGEFINPAIDCSHVLNENQQASDGYYWIDFNILKPRKLWCDMTTDGGGFFLVGRKITPETWTVPSSAIPVHPYGIPHWLSSVGDAPVMDFRVQIATSNNFKATKAHWFYRLSSTRPLKELLQNSDDCGYRSAGISDVAYVKDLQTETILNHNFSCSRFGYGYHSRSPTRNGWLSMNRCLQRPCPLGYVKESKDSQRDYEGAFSYSAVGKTSGMADGATAFVGCDGDTCCACFGPQGGRKNYCLKNCKAAINSGTITKTAFTWFWVRSSLPKIVWKKCMDYYIKRRDGKKIWYKLAGDSVVPIEGRCDGNNLNLLDGVVVVPSSKTAPPVEGLLSYRNQKLVLQSNGSSVELAQKSKILNELPKLIKPNLQKIKEELEKEINETSKNVNTRVKAKLDIFSRRINSQNISLSKRLEEVENEVETIKAGLTPPQATTRPSSGQRGTTAPTISSYPECSPRSIFINRNGYRWLNESSRNQEYRTVYQRCDDSLSLGWYRFGGRAGSQISTRCVPTRRCGTAATGWMTGSHPSTGEGKVTRTVSFHWNNDCHKWSQNIQVINCGPFYVYDLGPPSRGCNLGYCGSFH